MKRKRALTIKECNSGLVRVIELQSGKGLFAEVGEWVLKNLADFDRAAGREGKRPCVHLRVALLTEREIENYHRSDFRLELKGLIDDVEQRKPGPAR